MENRLSGLWKNCGMGFRMFWYSNRVKVNALVIGIFTAAGLFSFLIDACGAGVLLWALEPMLFSQADMQIASSEYVLSSPKSRQFQTVAVGMVEMIMSLILYLLAILIFAGGWAFGRFPVEVFNYCVFFGLFSVIIRIYSGMGYKHYLIAFVIYLAAFLVVYGVIIEKYDLSFNNMQLYLPVPALIALGYALIAAGSLGAQLLGRIFYRHDFSEMAMRMIWQRMDK